MVAGVADAVQPVETVVQGVIALLQMLQMFRENLRERVFFTLFNERKRMEIRWSVFLSLNLCPKK